MQGDERAIKGQLLPARALAAFKDFRDIIEGARAMLDGTFQKWLGSASDQSELDIEERSEPTDSRPASTAEVLKFLLDRTGYIKQLEEEDTPDSLARIDNLRELVNAAMDSRDRGETMQEFLDHAALVSDTDQYDAKSQITLMTLHSAKGLEFPLVVLAGMEEGLVPALANISQSGRCRRRTTLCYVGMTRAMDMLVLSRARYRRRYGTDMPEASIPSRFLEEVPPQLIEDIGSPGRRDSRVRRRAGRQAKITISDRRITSTKTKISGRDTGISSRRRRRTAVRLITPSTILPSFSRRAERSFRVRKLKSKHRRASADSVRDSV